MAADKEADRALNAQSAGFNKKTWLDNHIVPLLKEDPRLEIHHPFWNGDPPKEVLVLLRPVGGEADWPRACHRLLTETGFRFDLLREQQKVPMANGFFVVFGGDGAPLFNDEGFTSVRLLRKEDDGISLIVQVGYQYGGVPEASAAVKEFFALFKEDPLVVCQKYGAVFGQA